MLPDKFKYFVPVEFSKAKNEQGREVMKIGGVASTPHQDDDEEFLDPKGFDLKPFLSEGYLNWNHKGGSQAGAIVGYPTWAKVDDKGFMHLKGELLPGVPEAKNVYNLAKALKAAGNKRQLGFSIEGQVLERDPFDKRRVKKAKITGCAITPSPKNHYTYADIIKGHYEDHEDKYEMVVSRDENGGENEFIVDISQDGIRTTVDRNFNILIRKCEKAMTAGDQSGSELEGKDTTGAALKEESIAGQENKNKKKKGKKNKKKVEKLEKNLQSLTKAQIFSRIFSYFYGKGKRIDYSTADRVYRYVDRYFNLKKSKMSDFEFSEDKLNSLLGELNKSLSDDEPEGGDNLKKGNQPGEYYNQLYGSQKNGVPGAYYTKLYGKGSDTMKDPGKHYGKYKDMSDEEYQKAYSDKEKAYAGEKEAMDEDLKMMKKYRKGGDHAKKGEDFGELTADAAEAIVGNVRHILKGHSDSLESKFGKLVQLFEMSHKRMDSMQSQIEKGVEENKELAEKVEAYENEPVRKSFATQDFKERFPENNNDPLKKGSDGMIHLSQSQHRQELFKVLENESGIQKGNIEQADQLLLDAYQDLESVGSISEEAKQSLAVRGYAIEN